MEICKHVQKRYRQPESLYYKKGKTSVQYPRMTSFCGTVNDDEFLVDQTGNRRFAVIPFDDDFYIDYAKIKAFNFVQLWAEINAIIGDMLADGKTYADCFRFNRDELQELEKRNGKFIKPIPSQIEIPIVWKYTNVPEFANCWNDLLKKYTVQQIGRALTAVGVGVERVYINGIQQRTRKLPIIDFTKRIN